MGAGQERPAGTAGADAPAAPCGLGFRVGDWPLVVALRDLSEVIAVPPVRRVPGTRRWLRGVAAAHGRVLPVVDLAQYLLGTETEPGVDSRLLVVARDGLLFGLVAAEVGGLVTLPGEDADPDEVGRAPERLRACLGESTRVGDVTVWRFRVDALSVRRDFRDATEPESRAGTPGDSGVGDRGPGDGGGR